MLRFSVLLCLMTLLYCSQEVVVKNIDYRVDGLTFSLGFSLDRDNPQRVNGKLKVINDSDDLKKYGNFQLFLTADNEKVSTIVDTENSSSMVDKKLIDLMPGDTLEFFTYWNFSKEHSLSNSTFVLEYDNTIQPPAMAAKE